MKEITIISGKGGTGKTTVTAALAATGDRLVLCDGDVDAADLHLVLDPETEESYVFEGNWVAEIDRDKCTDCGICSEYCRFDAIIPDGNGGLQIHPFRCEGCRLCERICPSGAIHSARSTGNHWFVSATRFGKLVHARMGPGEENSGKLVTQVREKARELAEEFQASYILTDGPPGTGCPAIASVSGTDLVLLVIEPSITSLHDAGRVIELVHSSGTPVCAVLNKADIHPGLGSQIEAFLEEKGVPVLGRLPFREEVVEAMVAGKTLVEHDPGGEIAGEIRSVWKRIPTLFS
jgi:MinD superfamily P-loop ATPase